MKFIYKDLKNLLLEQPSKELLSEKLFQLGHEHEIIGDIFDIEFTPNRGDCLSLIGLSRDLNVFFENKEPFEIYTGEIDDLKIDFENLSPIDCPKITFLEIEIEGSISKYKPYLENYFSQHSINKTNFFTDVSNYISYEQGQPTHCFDATTITNRLIFENKVCDESFKTLLDSVIKLKDKNCVFTHNDEIISLAGVMGGMSTACTSKTSKAIIECAFFKPESIIGQSLKYNLVSDASYKFERGVDIASQERVLRRFIYIIQDHVAIKSIKLKSFSSKNNDHESLPININKINNILGVKLSESEYLNYLTKLGFEIRDKIYIPTFRHDISSQNDLAEEMARIIGYNNIPSDPLFLNSKIEIIPDKIERIRHFLVQKGFFEVINIPFSSNKDKHAISIDNPLDSNKNYLRTSLKNSLIENLLYNERRQKDSIKLFEISDIYTKDNEINQYTKLGIIISGRKGHNHIDFIKKLDSDYLKSIFNHADESEFFNIEEIERSKLKTKKKDKIYYLELIIDDIPDYIIESINIKKEPINFIKYQPISEFPSSSRDISFSIVDRSIYSEIVDQILKLKEENLTDAFIFDYYEDKKNDLIKLGIRLIFQSSLKTLSDKDINKSTRKALKPILCLDGVFVKGLDIN